MYNKKENLPALRRTVCCLLLTSMLLAALLGFAMPTSAAGSDDTPRRTLRVGFYAYTGYHVMDEDGHRSGYSYEVLQRIAQHENVQFEYLAYDCDANEAADMLERGEIDLLPTLRKTDERAERFDALHQQRAAADAQPTGRNRKSRGRQRAGGVARPDGGDQVVGEHAEAVRPGIQQHA